MKALINKLYAKKNRITRLTLIHHSKDFLLIVIGITMATLGLKEFLLPNGFLDGGAMGMSLLFNLKTGIDLSF